MKAVQEKNKIAPESTNKAVARKLQEKLYCLLQKY